MKIYSEEWWVEFFKEYDKRVDECKRKTGHTFTWVKTSIGGFAQCKRVVSEYGFFITDKGCGVVDDEIKEEDCINAPAILKEKSKAVKARDLKKRKEATIEYLKNKGLPYYE
jgi:hypothetical protein